MSAARLWRGRLRMPSRTYAADATHWRRYLAHPGDDRWTPTELSLRFFDRHAGPKRLAILDGCGHFPVEQPGVAQLEDELTAFLGTLRDP